METKRSTQVNKSMHLLFGQVSNELISQGIDRRTVILDLEGYDCPVTPQFIKEVWRSIMYTMYRKTSTTDLTNAEVKGCYEVFIKFMGENYGLSTGWPSVESLYAKDWYGN
jgi:hypothetical protein